MNEGFEKAENCHPLNQKYSYTRVVCKAVCPRDKPEVEVASPGHTPFPPITCEVLYFVVENFTCFFFSLLVGHP